MKIKRKQTTNGVKSSSSDKGESKSDLSNKNSEQTIKKMTVNNSSFNNINQNGSSNGLINVNMDTKKSNNTNKNSNFKDKKKLVTVNKTINNLKTENSKEKLNEINGSKDIKNEIKVDQSNPIILVSKDDEKLNFNNSTENLTQAEIKSLNLSKTESVLVSNLNDSTKTIDKNDLTPKSNSMCVSPNLKRDLDSSCSNNLKKKLKLDFVENIKSTETKEASTTTNVSTITEPECLGFCEPGSTVTLEGIVWQEAEGVLVVNVTWRGKTYVGTLLNSTKFDWAPPRFCDSPTSDLESKGGSLRNNGRSKRSRASISESENSKLQQSKLRNGKGRRNNFTVPPSPNRNGQDNSTNTKRSNSKLDNNSSSKQRSSPPLESNGTSQNQSNNQNSKNQQLPSPVLIECPEPNCNKKYKHINGLKYHQTHAHGGLLSSQNSNSNSTSISNNNLINLKQDDSSDSNLNNKDSEDTDTEDYDSSPSVKSKITSNVKLNGKLNCKEALKELSSEISLSKSSAYSDISDANDTENEIESRPSSNNSLHASQSLNSSIKTSETVEVKAINIDNSSSKSLVTSLKDCNSINSSDKKGSSVPFFCPPSSGQTVGGPEAIKLEDADQNQKKVNKDVLSQNKTSDENKTDDEKIKKFNESKIDHQNMNLSNLNTLSANDNLVPSNENNIHFPSNTGSINNVNNNCNNFNNGSAVSKAISSFSPSSLPLDPLLHSYLMQADLNYRINYERYLIEHQEKLFGVSNELNELEKERNKALLLAQNSASNSLNSFNKESMYKLSNNNHLQSQLTSATPSNSNNNRPSSTKPTHDRPTSTNSNLINGSNNLTSNNTQINKNLPSPFDFMDLEKQREELLKLSNSIRPEDQRFLVNKNFQHHQARLLSSPKKHKEDRNNSSINQSNEFSKSIKLDEGVKPTMETTGPPPHPNNFYNFPPSFLNPSSNQHLNLPPSYNNFSSAVGASVHHPHLPFDPTIFRGHSSPLQQSASQNLLPQGSTSSPFLNPLRYGSAGVGLTPVDAKLLASQHQAFLNSKKFDLINSERSLISPKSSIGNGTSGKITPNGTHRSASLSSNQNSSSLLNTSNNSNLSSASIGKKDENQSPTPRHAHLNTHHVGAGYLPLDPYGELIHQTASTCINPSK